MTLLDLAAEEMDRMADLMAKYGTRSRFHLALLLAGADTDADADLSSLRPGCTSDDLPDGISGEN